MNFKIKAVSFISSVKHRVLWNMFCKYLSRNGSGGVSKNAARKRRVNCHVQTLGTCQFDVSVLICLILSIRVGKYCSTSEALNVNLV